MGLKTLVLKKNSSQGLDCLICAEFARQRAGKRGGAGPSGTAGRSEGRGVVSYERGTPVTLLVKGCGRDRRARRGGQRDTVRASYNTASKVTPTLVSLSLRLKDLLGPVTRVKKKEKSCGRDRQARRGGQRACPQHRPTVGSRVSGVWSRCRWLGIGYRV